MRKVVESEEGWAGKDEDEREQGKGAGGEEGSSESFLLNSFGFHRLFLFSSTSLIGTAFSGVSAGSQRFPGTKKRCLEDRDPGWSLVTGGRGKKSFQASANFLDGHFTLPVNMHWEWN